jgi:hypothetical protein
MSMTRDQILQMNASARVYQERYDTAFEPWGVRVRAPVLGEDIHSYRRDLAVQTKRLLPDGHELKQVQYRRLPDDVFDNFEPQLRRAARETALRPDTVPLGQMRRVEQVDQKRIKDRVVDWPGEFRQRHDPSRPTCPLLQNRSRLFRC